MEIPPPGRFPQAKSRSRKSPPAGLVLPARQGLVKRFGIDLYQLDFTIWLSGGGVPS